MQTSSNQATAKINSFVSRDAGDFLKISLRGFKAIWPPFFSQMININVSWSIDKAVTLTMLSPYDAWIILSLSFNAISEFLF